MRKYVLWYVIGLLALLLLVYSPVVFDSHLLRFDDDLVVAPMAKVHSIQDYLQLIEKNEIYDVQPVRDFTYWVDSTHSGNLLIWFVSSVLVVACFYALQIPLWCSLCLGLLFAVNPLFVSSVAWLTARKHLLSFLFTVGMTLMMLIQTKKKNFPSWSTAFGFVILFMLAGFSQPINIMWPFFAAVYIFYKRDSIHLNIPRLVFVVFGISIVGLSVAYLNVRYYQGAFQDTVQTGKYVSDEFNTIFWKLWSWGRMYFQMILPIQTPGADHYPLSYFSGIGLVLFVLSVWIVWKLKVMDALVWIAGAMLAVFPVLARMTHIFAVDNYLLFSTFCIFVAIGILVIKYKNRFSGNAKIILVAITISVALVFSWRSYNLAKAWNNDFDLWKMSYEVEPSAKTAINYGGMLLEKGQLVKGLEVALESKKYVGMIFNAKAVLAKAIYMNPIMNTRQKIEMLNQSPNEWSLYYRASLQAAENGLAEACESIYKVKPLAKEFEFHPDVLELISAETLFFCKASPDVSNELVNIFKSIRRNGKWNEALFEKRAKELGVLK